MAHRNKPHDEELPFVALMDTMTNVVGVLIIVLVLIGLGLARSVQKVLSDLPMVSEEQHEKLQQDVKQFENKRDPEQVDAQIQKIEAELNEALKGLVALEDQQKKNPVVLENITELQKMLEALIKERDERRKTVHAMLFQVNDLKKKLDDTPPYIPPPPGVVLRIPNPRPMPEKAEVHRFIFTENRLVRLRDLENRELVEKELSKGRREVLVKRENVVDAKGAPVMKQLPGGMSAPQTRMIFNAKKLEAFFSTDPLRNRDLLIGVAQIQNSPNLELTLIPKPGAGESFEQFRMNSSRFQSDLRDLKKDKDSVVWFHVCRDSILAYHRAREIVDAIGIPVGWELWDRPAYAIGISPDYQGEFTPPPPPPPGSTPPPAPKPSGPPPIQIKPPKKTLD